MFQAAPGIELIDGLNALSYEERNRSPANSLEYAEKALAESEKINYPKGRADALNNIGFYYVQITEHEKSLEFLLKALELQEKINNDAGIANAHYNLAVLQIRYANFTLALDYLHKCIPIREKLNDQAGLALCYFQSAYINDMFGHDEESIHDIEKGLEIREKLNDRIGIAALYNLLARTYTKQNRFDEARKIVDKALSLRSPNDEIRGYFASAFTKVELEIKCGNLTEAKKLGNIGLKIATEHKEWFGVMRYNLSLGKIALLEDDCEKAGNYFMDALKIAEARKFNSIKYEVFEVLSDMYLKNGNYLEALNYYKKFHLLKEEILNAQSSSRLKSVQLMNQIEASKREAELERLKNVDLKNAFREIEEKNREILDSIKYASRIQRALLPSEFYFEKYFGRS
ncbi:MAG: DUF5112 domain-containing protein [Bacteroidia bacterium]